MNCIDHDDALLEYLLMIHKQKSTSSCSGFGSMGGTSSKRRNKVSFSESSRLYVYEPYDRNLLKSLSYTKEDYDEFNHDTLADGLRIKNLINAAPQESISESIKYLLRNRNISRSELVGNENCILGKPSGISKIRRQHSAAVLRKQHEQRKEQLQDPTNLEKVAQISSVKSAQRARVRAAMAA
mmetsp:Transcript_18111/g.28415  ORF Transcript_18111/g.28415 Transcript_18111/m.28415 type:complete len:183 (-) Transcript_18111:60-608(-)